MFTSPDGSQKIAIESVNASSSALSLDLHSMQMGLLRQTMIHNQSTSEFCTDKIGSNAQTPHNILQQGLSPREHTTTNESYSVDNFFQGNNSDGLARMLGINSNNSQPSTTKGNVPKKEFPDIDDSEQDQIKDIEFIEYEEFAPKPQTIKNEQPAASHHKVMSNLDLPFSGERILKLKDLPQSSGKSKSSSLRHSLKERARLDQDPRFKMFSDSSTKDLTEGGRDAILSERAHKPRASFETDHGNLRGSSFKREKESSTEHSENSPMLNKDRKMLMKETELLRNILREKEVLLGKSSKPKQANIADLRQKNEELNKENALLRSELAKANELLKGKGDEMTQLREANHNQREAALKIEEKYMLLEKTNFNFEKERKSREDELKNLQEENQMLKGKKMKYKENIKAMQQNFDQLKNKYENMVKTLNQEKQNNQNAEKVKVYKAKVSQLKNTLKEHQETIVSKDNAIVNLLGKLDELVGNLAKKDAEITKLKEDNSTLSEELKVIKSEKAKMRTKSTDDFPAKLPLRESLIEATRDEVARSGTKKPKKNRNTHHFVDFETNFNLSKKSTQSQESGLHSFRDTKKLDEKSITPVDLRKTEKLKTREQFEHSDRTNSLEKHEKTIKKEKTHKTRDEHSKENRMKNLNIGQALDQQKLSDAYYIKKGDVHSTRVHPNSARGERGTKESRTKDFDTPASGSLTEDLKTLNINKHILANEAITRRRFEGPGSNERKAISQEREREIKINNFLKTDKYKRYASPADEGSHQVQVDVKTSRNSRHDSKRPSNIDKDYFDPYDIVAVNSKPPLMQIPLSVTNSSADVRRDMMSARSVRESVFRKVSREGRDYSEEISGMSQLRGTNFTTMDNSKSYVKSERPSKGGSKKPSSLIFKHHEDA